MLRSAKVTPPADSAGTVSDSGASMLTIVSWHGQPDSGAVSTPPPAGIGPVGCGVCPPPPAPDSAIQNVITEPGLLTEATKRLLERTATHTRTVTAAQRRLFSLWLNHPLDAAVEHSTDEFAETFAAQETRDQIAHHYRRITGRST